MRSTDGDADVAAPEEGEVNPPTPDSLRTSSRSRKEEQIWYHGLRYPALDREAASLQKSVAPALCLFTNSTPLGGVARLELLPRHK